jgi:serine/threonine protein kinase
MLHVFALSTFLWTYIIIILIIGQYGIVYKAICDTMNPPVEVAIKTLRIQEMDKQSYKTAVNEGQLMMSLQHPNVLSCYDVFLEGGQLHIVLELAGG